MPEGTEGPEDYMPSDNHGSEVVVEKEYTLSQDSFFCVFDGMGGGDFGEVASYTAAKTAREYLAVEQHINPCDITPSLTEMCNVINQAVYQAGMKSWIRSDRLDTGRIVFPCRSGMDLQSW